jgi:2-oxoisovalerate ferredoxin oxidoreductase beta subunit
VADELGDPRITNMVMLGALLEITQALPQSCIDSALRRLVKSERWLDLDKRALDRGGQLHRDSLAGI